MHDQYIPGEYQPNPEIPYEMNAATFRTGTVAAEWTFGLLCEGQSPSPDQENPPAPSLAYGLNPPDPKP